MTGAHRKRSAIVRTRGPIGVRQRRSPARGAERRAAGAERSRPLKGLSTARNKYEHDLVPEAHTRENGERYLNNAPKIIARVCGGSALLTSELRRYRFPILGAGAST